MHLEKILANLEKVILGELLVTTEDMYAFIALSKTKDNGDEKFIVDSLMKVVDPFLLADVQTSVEDYEGAIRTLSKVLETPHKEKVQKEISSICVWKEISKM